MYISIYIYTCKYFYSILPTQALTHWGLPTPASAAGGAQPLRGALARWRELRPGAAAGGGGGSPWWKADLGVYGPI